MTSTAATSVRDPALMVSPCSDSARGSRIRFAFGAGARPARRPASSGVITFSAKPMCTRIQVAGPAVVQQAGRWTGGHPATAADQVGRPVSPATSGQAGMPRPHTISS